MKKTSFLLLLLVLSASLVKAQPTQAEINKMLKDAQVEIDKLKKDPKTAEQAKNMPDIENINKIIAGKDKQEALKNIKTGLPASSLPARNNKLLSTLSKKIFSRQELLSFLSLLYADLQKKLPAGKVKSAQAIILQLNKDPVKIAGTGVVAWYKNAAAEAALLLVYAASQSPDDVTLNNCGAVLNLCGLEDKSIPILKYILSKGPTNSTLLNNIGQAYTGLGATDTALYYLMGCIRQNANHPEACATVAYIEYEKGNIAKAQQYAEQALQGGYSPGLAKFYKKIKRDGKLSLLLKNRLSQEKYFVFNGFTIAPNCHSWEESEEVYAKQEIFRKKIKDLNAQFQEIIIKNTSTDIREIYSTDMREGPFAKLAQEIKDGFADIYLEQKNAAHISYINKLPNIVQEKYMDYAALGAKYTALYKAATGNPPLLEKVSRDNCLEHVALDNKWFEKEADLVDRYKNIILETDIQNYNTMVYLTTMTAPTENIFKSECAADATFLLNNFSLFVLDNCNPKNKRNCVLTDPAKEQEGNSPVFNQANCPINLEIPFGAGTVSLNCARFKIEGGQGILLGYEKNFITRESTVAIGVGIGGHIPCVDFGVKGQLYIKFDKDNQPTDTGLLAEAGIDVQGLTKPDMSTGVTLGINSGFNYQPGALSGFLN